MDYYKKRKYENKTNFNKKEFQVWLYKNEEDSCSIC